MIETKANVAHRCGAFGEDVFADDGVHEDSERLVRQVLLRRACHGVVPASSCARVLVLWSHCCRLLVANIVTQAGGNGWPTMRVQEPYWCCCLIGQASPAFW